MTPDYSPLFKKWRTDISLAPKDGTWIMGRFTGTNRSGAVRWDDAAASWLNMNGKPVNICQWILMQEFADIRSCVWRAQ